jgi:IS30 family transposase
MRPKITRYEATRIRQLYRSGIGCKILAHRFGVANSTISSVVRNRTWKDPVWAAELLLFDTRSPARKELAA